MAEAQVSSASFYRIASESCTYELYSECTTRESADELNAG